jgi:uncharacterized membrane protein
MRTEHLKSAFLSILLAFSIVMIAVSLLQHQVLATSSRAYGIQLERRDFIGLLPAQSWDASVTATFSGLSDDASFGVRPDATSGFDTKYDLPEPPAPPEENYVRTYFDYPGQVPRELHRSCLAPENLKWPLRIDCHDGIENVILTWNIENVPAEYNVLLYRGDNLDNLVADMRSTGSYTFGASSGSYDFRILVSLPSKYTLTISSTAGGTTDPSPGSYSYPAGTFARVAAHPASGYSFVRWELDGSPSATNPIDVLMDSDHNLHAVFEAIAPQPGPSLGVDVSISPSSQSGSKGAALTYTVTVSNTGNDSDTYTLENTDNAGWIKSLSSPSLTISGKSSDVVMLSVTIPNAQDGAWDNITVKATSQTNSSITAKDSCAAHVIQGVVGVQISITPENQTGAPGSTLTYTVKVTNGSNGQDNFDLSVSGGAGWNPQISPSSLTLAAGASGNSTLSVPVLGEASGGSSVGISITATSRTNPTVSASASCIASAAVVLGVRLSISPSEDSGSPGVTLKYTITVTNTGNVVDNYNLAVTDNSGWNLKLSSSILTISIKGLEKIVLDVTIPGNAKLSASDNITVTARSRADPIISDSASCRAIATGPSAISLAVPLIAIVIIIILTGGYLFFKFMGKGGRRRRVLSARTLYSFVEAKIEDGKF